MKRWILGEFASTTGLLEAARKVREAGFTDLDTHSPYPIHGAEEALGLKRSRVPLLTLFGALGGAVAGYSMIYWMNAIDYRINVGGRPINSPPLNIPIAFETTILIAALATVVGLLVLFFGFPQPYHPVFELDAFKNACTDGLWLSIPTEKEGAPEQLVQQLKGLGATQVSVVQESE